MLHKKQIKLARKQAIASFILGASLISSVSYADSTDALWKDKKTGLTWMRCSIGQRWVKDSCKGKATKMTWQEAVSYVPVFNSQIALGGRNDWRLPTITELAGIRHCKRDWAREDSRNIGYQEASKATIILRKVPNGRGAYRSLPYYCSKHSQVINNRIFPNAEKAPYWSVSNAEEDANSAWAVSFYYGYTGYFDKDARFYIRLVRDK